MIGASKTAASSPHTRFAQEARGDMKRGVTAPTASSIPAASPPSSAPLRVPGATLRKSCTRCRRALRWRCGDDGRVAAWLSRRGRRQQMAAVMPALDLESPAHPPARAGGARSPGGAGAGGGGATGGQPGPVRVRLALALGPGPRRRLAPPRRRRGPPRRPAAPRPRPTATRPRPARPARPAPAAVVPRVPPLQAPRPAAPSGPGGARPRGGGGGGVYQGRGGGRTRRAGAMRGAGGGGGGAEAVRRSSELLRRRRTAPPRRVWPRPARARSLSSRPTRTARARPGPPRRRIAGGRAGGLGGAGQGSWRC